jgi:hypothetical protein
MESLTALIEEYRVEKKMHHMEGSTGFENLCRLVRAIGYRDSLHQMQFRDGCVGDLMVFFEDNPGAIEAIVTWIGEQDNEEWKESLESELPEKTCEECGATLETFMNDTDGTNLEEVTGCPKCDGGKCPACGEPLQDDVCQNTDCDS